MKKSGEKVKNKAKNEKKTLPDIQNSLLLALLEPHYWPMLECSSMPQSFCKPWKKVESIWFVLQRQNLRNLPKLLNTNK